MAGRMRPAEESGGHPSDIGPRVGPTLSRMMKKLILLLALGGLLAVAAKKLRTA
jgi:hypothetical protein